jgi:hypothetical protein
MQYLAIIGDIVDSKQLPRRDEFQTKLAGVLKNLSSRNSSLVSPYTITLGDEFQAVYKNADRLFADIFYIMASIDPAQVRFAIGVGELSTEVNRKQALGMDGPAFHRARNAITELKKTDYRIRLQGEPVSDDDAVQWKLMNHVFNLLTHQIGGWSRNRLHIMHGLLTGKTVTELEAELGVTNVAVYKNINAAALNEFKGLCDEVTRLLNNRLQSR